MAKTDLKALRTLTNAGFSASSAALSANIASEAQITDQINALMTQYRKAPELEERPAAKARADLTWQAWAEVRITVLNSARARLRARQVALRAEVQLLHARQNVLEELSKKEAFALRRKQARTQF